MNVVPGLLKIFTKRTLGRLAVAFGVLLLPVFAFVKIASEIREGDTLQFDEYILRAINGQASPLLDKVVIVATQFGGLVGVPVLTAGIVIILWVQRMRRMAVLLFTGVSGAVLLNLILKAIFQRDRPHLWERLMTENSYSFPSGHAMASSALAFSLIVIYWPTRWRWPVLVAAGLYMVVIALTRLYLGVHYPTDILGGWAVSAAWIATMVYVLTYGTTLRNLFRRNRI